MSSIRKNLVVFLFVGLTAATLIATVAVYMRAREEARTLFDYQLELMANAFPNEGFALANSPLLEDADRDVAIVVEIWDQNGERIFASRSGILTPQNVDLGLSTVAIEHGEWRVYAAIVGKNVVQVSQPISVREDLAASLALRTTLPFLTLLPVLIIMIWMIVGRGLRPLITVTSAVSRRSAEVLEPLGEDNLPGEVKPLVRALNDLLARLRRALSLQRSFIADAAHELRTPLTAIKLQLQVAERANTEGDRRAALSALSGGIERTSRLVEQLLDLARNEPDAPLEMFTTLNLAEIAWQVVADRAAMADAKRLDIGLSGGATGQIAGDASSIYTLIGNLVDNAIRCTPEEGAVDVGIGETDTAISLTVTDTGPGIPVAERERVFDRFFRGPSRSGPGSGLGLAIVSKIAERHHAAISLDSGPSGHGLKVVVSFPRQTPPSVIPAIGHQPV